MADNNTTLIHRILDGEEEAFGTLVQKYQKQIHALAWRKVGDYHIAEEITQDTFLQVYQKLSDLRNPKQFDGWLYVIAVRQCWNYLRRNKTKTQSIEDTPVDEIEHTFFSQHEAEQRDIDARMGYREIVKKLLEKLPESERTVVTLYYLGEMTVKDIGKFLGVSVNTIKSRLRRARNRLKSEEQILMTEHLGGLQLSTDLTESIMRQIADLKPTPTVVKPLIPWTAFGTAAILVLLLLGALHQQTNLFQEPFSFEAETDMTVELVDAPLTVQDVPKESLRTIIGKSTSEKDSEGVGSQESDTVVAAIGEQFSPRRSFTQWTQTNGPHGSRVFDLFASSKNHIYASSQLGIYRMREGETEWTSMNAGIPKNMFNTKFAEHRGILYYTNVDDIIASTDDGETWNTFCDRPEGLPVDLIVTDHYPEEFIIYLALRERGVYQSVDRGQTWTYLNDEFIGKRITDIAQNDGKLYIGTNAGLYLFRAGRLTKLPLDERTYIQTITIHKDNIYVVTGTDFTTLEANWDHADKRVFHSADKGLSWVNITGNIEMNPSPDLITKLLVSDEAIVVMGMPAFRSTDQGKTWNSLGFNMDYANTWNTPSITTNETFYKVGSKGSVIRSNDHGISWQPFMDGMFGIRVQELALFDNKIYIYTGHDHYQSDDDGDTWKKAQFDFGEFTPTTSLEKANLITYPTDDRLVIVNNVLYRVAVDRGTLYILSLHPGEEVFSNAQKIDVKTRLENGDFGADTAEIIEEIYGKNRTDKINLRKNGGFAINADTIYLEYKRLLLKWHPDSQHLTYTGLLDTGMPTADTPDYGVKVAAFAQNVYVGKRDGSLLHSIDRGRSWRDITTNLPTKFGSINDIKNVGTTVYVATNEGVLASANGEHWRMLTDNVGVPPIIGKFAVDGERFYGVGKTGVYQLDRHSRWEQVSRDVPDKVITFSVSGDKVYIGTKRSGIFRTSLSSDADPSITVKH